MKHKKIIIISIIALAVIFIISALSNSTYALFSSDDYGANANNYTTGTLVIEAESKSENISLDNVLPMTDKEGKETTPYVFTIKNTGNLDYKFNVKLLSTGDSNTTFSSSYIKLQIDDGDVTTLATLNGVIKSDVTLLAGETMDISIRVWLDEETPNSEIGKSFNSRIVTDGEAVYTSTNNEYKQPLVDYINNLYNNAEKEEYTSADGLTYNLASSVHLMNDRFGSADTGINDGNIRFYGGNTEVNNYIDIGDRTTDGEVIPYRIIGLFKDIEVVNNNGTTKEQDLIKVIRADSIGTYSWDNKTSGIGTATNANGYGSNNWMDARLMMLLNPGYENNAYDNKNNLLNEHNRSYYWNSTGTSSSQVKCYSSSSNGTKDCYFESTGLSAEARSKIAKTTWTIGSFSSSSVYGNSAYQTERAGTEWQGHVALMYVSDMYYSRNLKGCTGNLSSRCAVSNNWLYLSSTEWSLAPYSSDAYGVWYLTSGRLVYNVAYYARGVRPVFYLKSELGIESEHDGTKTDPYRIS